MQTVARFALALTLALPATPEPLAPGVRQALAAISANELKGDLSFLASDALQGRFTPSPGLDVAAEFIAAKFRAAGLEPGGDHDYFQTVEMVDRRLPKMTDLTISAGDRRVVVPAAEVWVDAVNQAVHLENVPLLVLSGKDAAAVAGLDLKGKAVMAPAPDWQKLTAERRIEEWRKAGAFDQAVSMSGASLEITIVRARRVAAAQRLLSAEQAASRCPVLSVRSEELSKLAAGAILSVDIPAPVDNKVTLKNVIGILRGSDPVLSKTAVLLTAHYDHIGTIETAGELSMHGPGDSSDRIYNGANDDGSGTVSVIEIARAISQLHSRPKRSVVFMTFFGEERGELGSQFYGRHPVFPIGETVADVNLEQVGRTDSTAGAKLKSASFTGYDYSDVTAFFERAGARLGIEIYRDPEASDSYFTRSDNDALAEQGVPAHTMCVAFDFPDYHGVGDEWQKIDYENMAKVDRMVLLGLLDLANSLKAPQWNAQNPKTAPFRAARAASLRTE
jgi:hypothetical protein